MYKIGFSILLLVFGITARGQEGNYLYIDASNGQLFYIKLNNKIYSSSAGGYVIIPGIRESKPELGIGFPGDVFPEQRFLISMNNSDQGFHLKNSDQGWQLINLKTIATIQNSTPPKSAADPDQVKKSDAFSVLLSKVVNDSSVLFAGSKAKTPPTGTASVNAVPVDPVPLKDTAQKETVITAPVKPATEPVMAVKETTKIPDTSSASKNTAKDTAQNEVAVISPVTNQELIKEEHQDVIVIPSPVRKLFDQYFEKVYEATYVDKNNGKYDTIRISYPINADTSALPINQSVPAVSAAPAITAVTEKVADSTKDNSVEADDKKVQNTAAIKAAEVNPNTTVPDTTQDTTTPVAKAATPCRMVANDQDVDNLRVKILQGKNTEDKLGIAKVYFESKCYSVKQIKGLSELFGGDEDKYLFFDAAHLHISDSANFPGLISELKEDYYRNRFKAIIRK